MNSKETKDIELILKDGPRIEQALKSAVRDALRWHKFIGNPIAVWRDGQVVWIPPEEIRVSEESGRESSIVK